jgi:hypothetical protein
MGQAELALLLRNGGPGFASLIIQIFSHPEALKRLILRRYGPTSSKLTSMVPSRIAYGTCSMLLTGPIFTATSG